jgi:hypothetical protein
LKVIIIKEDHSSPTFPYKIGDVVATGEDQGKHWIKIGLAKQVDSLEVEKAVVRRGRKF